MNPRTLFQRHVALPPEHGAWVFLLGPLLIGLLAAGQVRVPSIYLVVAAVAGFLIRQPVTIVVKALSGRRSRESLPAAGFWIAVYGGIAAIHVLGLVLRGFGYVLWLIVPGLPVLAYHLYLISRRAERRQWLVEIAAAGALALSATAAYWIGVGRPDPVGWWLWVLGWAQSVAAILYAYLRLEQRALEAAPAMAARFRMGRTALAVASGNGIAVSFLCATGALPLWLFLPYLIQVAETLWGVTHPAVGARAKAIGYRQLRISIVFTVLFVLAWWRGVPGAGS